MKILDITTPGMGKPMGEDEINKFLENKFNLHIATVDDDGDPNIQPVWFYHDREQQKFYISTAKGSRKVANIRKNPRVYFAIDEIEIPYRCVKGKGKATVSEETTKNIPFVEKICIKYNGSLDHPFSKLLLEEAKTGSSVVLELTPRFYSTWDFTR